MEDKKQVIFTEWSSKGRDFEIDLPLMYFFEKILKWEVLYISIFNLPKILKTKPDLIIMACTTGANINYNIAKLIKNSNILFFSHVSEGIFKEIVLEHCLWGWNSEKLFNENLSMLWSKKTYDMSLNKYKYLDETLRVSGSIGHDKYKIYQNSTINDNKYKKVVAYAAYDFDYAIIHKDRILDKHGEKIYNTTIKDISIINNILKTIIKDNPDILFILKNHPGSKKKISLELEELNSFENTMIVIDEYSIVDVISFSDILLNYRSSTNLEAWLLDKPSISFCTDDFLLDYTEVCYGSVIENNSKVIEDCIQEFYQTGKIEKFEDKKDLQEKLIKDMIGFDDGLNHVRFMSFLKPYIEKIENSEIKKNKWSISFKDKMIGYIKHVVYSVSKGKYSTPYIKKWANIYGAFSEKEIEEQKSLRYPNFDAFYKKNRVKIDILYSSYASNWREELDINR